MVSNDRFEKLESNPVGKDLDPSSTGAINRRFRRWLEFKGEKPTQLELEPDKPKAARAPTGAPAPSVYRPQPSPPVAGGLGQEIRSRAARLRHEEVLYMAQDRARRARRSLLWIFIGLGIIIFLMYLRYRGGIGGVLAEMIMLIIATVVVAMISHDR